MKILFIGCGNMGAAIVKAMLNSKQFTRENIDVVLPIDSPHYNMVNNEIKLNIYEKYPDNKSYDAIIFAVKPQILNQILPTYSQSLYNSKTLIISIAAGKNIAFYEKFFPLLPIIRVMPNINIQITRGATAAYGNNKVKNKHNKLVENIFSATGYFTWLESEDLIDTVIAISGSSPAYYFLFTEHLIKLGVEHGLEFNIAQKLAEEAFIGSALMKDSSTQSLTELREMVTSFKGTTHDAISKFEAKNSLYKLIKTAFKAAIKRSKELSI